MLCFRVLESSEEELITTLEFSLRFCLEFPSVFGVSKTNMHCQFDFCDGQRLLIEFYLSKGWSFAFFNDLSTYLSCQIYWHKVIHKYA